MKKYMNKTEVGTIKLNLNTALIINEPDKNTVEHNTAETHLIPSWALDKRIIPS